MKRTPEAIKTAYNHLRQIESAADLKRERLTLAEYHTAGALFNEVNTPGSTTETFFKAAAEFFARCGYEVKPAGVNYRITAPQ